MTVVRMKQRIITMAKVFILFSEKRSLIQLFLLRQTSVGEHDITQNCFKFEITFAGPNFFYFLSSKPSKGPY